MTSPLQPDPPARDDDPWVLDLFRQASTQAIPDQRDEAFADRVMITLPPAASPHSSAARVRNMLLAIGVLAGGLFASALAGPVVSRLLVDTAEKIPASLTFGDLLPFALSVTSVSFGVSLLCALWVWLKCRRC